MYCSVNVSVGQNEERLMMTGLHTVADIFCVGCGSVVGWVYVCFPSCHVVNDMLRVMLGNIGFCLYH